MGNSQSVAMFAPSPRGSRSQIIPGYEPTPVSSVKEMVVVDGVRLVTIDEAWKFDALEELLVELKARGVDCVVATYQISGDGFPFDNTSRLMYLADKVITRQGQCYVCGALTSLTQVACRDTGTDWYLLPDEDFAPDHTVTGEAFAIHEKLNFVPVCGRHYASAPKQDNEENVQVFLESVELSGSKQNPERIEVGKEITRQTKKITSLITKLLGITLLIFLLKEIGSHPLRYLYPVAGLGVLMTIFCWWRFCLVFQNRWKRRFFVALLTFCSLSAPTLIIRLTIDIAGLTVEERLEVWQYFLRTFFHWFLSFQTLGLVMSAIILVSVALLYARVTSKEIAKKESSL